MLELIKGLAQDDSKTEILLVLLNNVVDYDYVYTLPIRMDILDRRGRKDLGIFRKLNRLIRIFQPDLIHSWSTLASVYTCAVNFFPHRPFLNGVIADSCLKGWFNKDRIGLRLTRPFSKVVVANSEAGLKAYHVPSGKGVCIYNGIDFNRFKNLRSRIDIIKEIFGSNNEQLFVVVMVAAFEDRKDYFTLTKAALTLIPRYSNMRFLLIGEGKNREEIASKIPVDLLDRSVYFLGKRNDVESILQIANVGVLLTNEKVHGEGISNSILEYMVSGLPVIATRGGGTDEIVHTGKNGFLISCGNNDELVEKISWLVDNPDQAVRMGQNGYELARDQFNLEKMTRSFWSLYTKLVSSS